MRNIAKEKIVTVRNTAYDSHNDAHEHFADKYLTDLKGTNKLKMIDLVLFSDWLKQAGIPKFEITDLKTAKKWHEPIKTVQNVRLKLTKLNIIFFNKHVKAGKLYCEYHFGKKAVYQEKYFEQVFGEDYMTCSAVITKYTQDEIDTLLFQADLKDCEKEDIYGLLSECVGRKLKKRQAFRVVNA